MYKRSAIAIIKNPPPPTTCFIECQFGEAKYSEKVSGCITTRIDAGGCWFVQVKDERV